MRGSRYPTYRSIVFLVIILLSSTAPAQIIQITSTLKTDGKVKKFFKEYYTEWNRKGFIQYSFDSTNNTFEASKYLVKKDVVTFLKDTVRVKRKTEIKEVKQTIDRHHMDSLIQSLKIPDTVNLPVPYMHTSHRYANIYVRIISNNDTLTYLISNPSYAETNWYNLANCLEIPSNKIDLLIIGLMPEEFLLRNALKKRL